MRRTNLFLTIFFLVSGSVALAQSTPAEPTLPQVLGPRLVAWSELQRPQPVTETADRSPDQSQAQESSARQSGTAQPAEPADSDTQQQHSRAQAFTGTIVRDGKEYMLKVSQGSAYELDDPEKAKAYEGKQVKVAGKLDPKSNVLHVLSIELVS